MSSSEHKSALQSTVDAIRDTTFSILYLGHSEDGIVSGTLLEAPVWAAAWVLQHATIEPIGWSHTAIPLLVRASVDTRAELEEVCRSKDRPGDSSFSDLLDTIWHDVESSFEMLNFVVLMPSSLDPGHWLAFLHSVGADAASIGGPTSKVPIDPDRPERGFISAISLERSYERHLHASSACLEACLMLLMRGSRADSGGRRLN